MENKYFPHMDSIPVLNMYQKALPVIFQYQTYDQNAFKVRNTDKHVKQVSLYVIKANIFNT
jgi:hypothetical protein